LFVFLLVFGYFKVPANIGDAVLTGFDGQAG